MGTTAELNRTVLPPPDVDELQALFEALKDAQDRVLLVTQDDRGVVLPQEVLALLTDMVAAMRNGQAITFAPLSQRLTTQQAADLLGVSRPTVVKLLESGAIPYEKPGRHRRIRLSDLLAFRDVRRGERRAALAEMTFEAENLGLGEDGPDVYEAALKEARAKLA